MRKLSHLFVAALVAGMLLPAFALAGSDLAPQKFGAPVTVKKAVDIAKLAKAPEKFDGQTVRLEGVVKEVCQGRGCWVDVANGKGVSFLAKSLDETVLLPKDCKGRRVVVQGVVKMLPAAAAEEPEPKDHACPKPTYVVSTQGIELHAAR